MYSLTKEQKLSNYREILKNLKSKRENIEEQILSIEKKISKLEGSTDPYQNMKDLLPGSQNFGI